MCMYQTNDIPQLFIAMYLVQIVPLSVIALFIVKRFVWTPLIIPAILITLLVHHVGSRLLQRSWDVLSMKAAHHLDLDDQQDAVDLLRQQKANAAQGNLSAQQQQQQQDDDAEALGFGPVQSVKVYQSQAVSWGEVYSPSAVQLLDQAEAVQSGLRQRVAVVQARLTAHNAAAEAAAALRKQQKHRTRLGQQQKQKVQEMPVPRIGSCSHETCRLCKMISMHGSIVHCDIKMVAALRRQQQHRRNHGGQLQQDV